MTTSAFERLSYKKWERQPSAGLPELEWEDIPRRSIQPDRFQSCTADRGYLDMTDFEVTPETFEKEERRTGKMGALEDRSQPPGGLTCSMRLGQVATLL